MRLISEQLPQALKRGMKPLYAVFGAETLLALESADAIRASARAAGHDEREVLTVESGFKWSELAMAGSAQSLFASKKILELRIPTGKPGVEGAAALQALAKAPPDDTVTLITLPEVDWRAQKAAWFEALDQAGVLVEARVVPPKLLPQWLAARLAAQGQEAEPEALAFIAERVEGNLLAAFQEVQKLALLLAQGRITYDDVRAAVTDVARYDVFAFGEVMLAGDPARMTRTLEGLKGEGAAPPMLLWAITEEIRAIGRVLDAAAGGRPLAGVWREARVWGPAHQAAMQQNLSRFSAAQVEQGLKRAAAIDRLVKGLRKGDAWDELLQLALRFARK
jgi:DNA polymerase-3 subunit delta